MKTTSTVAQCAAAIKAEVTNLFPNVNFSVTSKSFSMGNSVHVSWDDGPTEGEITTIIKKYEYGTFDGMTDSYNITNRRNDLPQTKYLHTSRSISREANEILFPFIVPIYEQEIFTEAHNASNLLYQLFYQCSFPGGAKFTGIEEIPGVVSGSRVHEFYKITYDVPEVKQLPAVSGNGLRLVDYSEKAIAIVGEETRNITEQLKALGGRFNRNLRCGAGWIFPKTKQARVISALNINTDATEGENDNEGANVRGYVEAQENAYCDNVWDSIK